MQQVTAKTIKIEYATAATIRCVAKQDIPEYGIKKDQVFYLVRSSANDGTYYICQWSYEQACWLCSCPATVRNCRHARAAAQAARARKMRIEAAAIQPSPVQKPVIQPAAKGSLNQSRPFFLPPTWKELEAQRLQKKAS